MWWVWFWLNWNVFFFQLLFIFLLWEESHQSKIKFQSTVVIASLAESKKKLTSRKEASTDCKFELVLNRLERRGTKAHSIANYRKHFSIKLKILRIMSVLLEIFSIPSITFNFRGKRAPGVFRWLKKKSASLLWSPEWLTYQWRCVWDSNDERNVFLRSFYMRIIQAC